MIFKMKPGASKDETEEAAAVLAGFGFDVRRVSLPFGRFLAGVGEGPSAPGPFEKPAGVEWTRAAKGGPVLAALEANPARTRVALGAVSLGGDDLAIIAGPCSVESKQQMETCARFVSGYGACALRGGAYKPRTSPYSFQGLGKQALAILSEAGRAFHLPVVSEIMDPSDLEVMEDFVDCLQIGARSMQNFPLLRAVGKSGKPVLLKRGPAAGVDELLMAAEYLLLEGNPNVILCERGIKTFEKATRNTLDLNAVPVLKSKTHLPVVVDPSHGTGLREVVVPMARAAVAAGADGLLVEVHPHPDRALSDGGQSLTLEDFKALMEAVRPVAEAMGRSLSSPGGAFSRPHFSGGGRPGTTGWGGG